METHTHTHAHTHTHLLHSISKTLVEGDVAQHAVKVRWREPLVMEETHAECGEWVNGNVNKRQMMMRSGK